jgi:hypothetical protein
MYSETHLRGKYSVMPFSRDREKLKSRVEEFGRKHDHVESQAKAQIMQLLEDLDEKAQNEIRELLKDRNCNATEPYGWKIAAILDSTRDKSGRRAFWGHRREARKARRWLIVLRGGVLDSQEDEFKDLPGRFSNPWGEEYRRQGFRSRASAHSRDMEYKKRLEEDLRKSGMDERQISVVLKKGVKIDPNKPTYTRMSRKHLSLETLKTFKINYEFDQVRPILLAFDSN